MISEESYQEISISVLSDDVDPVSNYIIENIANGILLEEEEGCSHVVMKFYVSAEIDIDEKLSHLRKYLMAINPEYDEITAQCKEIKNIDWVEAYEKSVKPVEAGNTIVIVPPWDESEFKNKVKIIIQPNMAFGTGKHETTRSCLAELETIDIRGKSVLDLGCGSGILSIYCACRGASDALGFDTDPLAIENSKVNFGLNKVEEVCRVQSGSIDDLAENKQFDIVLVNIIKKVIFPIIGRLKQLVAPDGRLILSGLLLEDKVEIEKTLAKNKLNDYSLLLDGNWITYNIQL